MRPSECDKLIGPSLARSKRDFVAKFGTERELLAKTNELISEMEG